MNRAEATEALQAGKRVERVIPGGTVQPMRWHGTQGMQVQFGSDYWEAESNGTGDDVERYRLAEPRVFLGVWREVDEPAEIAGYDEGRPSYMAHWKGIVGSCPAESDFIKNANSDFCWVERIKDVPTRDELKAMHPGRNVLVTGLAEAATQDKPPSGFVFCDEPWAPEGNGLALAYDCFDEGRLGLITEIPRGSRWRWIRPAGVPVHELQFLINAERENIGGYPLRQLEILCDKYGGNNG